MNDLISKFIKWIHTGKYSDMRDELAAKNVQAISTLIVIASLGIGVVYLVGNQPFYVFMSLLIILVFSAVIFWVRAGYVKMASAVLLLSTLGLLAYGIFMAGGIHSSSSIIFPVILVFASLLLDRRLYILYTLLCILTIGFLIFAENRGLTPVPYVPDPANLALFITYALIIVTSGIIIRGITESLQNATLKMEKYASEILAHKSMLEQVGQAVVGCTNDSTIVYWNKAAERLYGWKSEEVIGEEFFDVVSTNLTTQMAEGIFKALKNDDVWSGDLLVTNKEHEQLHVWVTVASLQTEDGKPNGWIGIATDLTEREHVETELRKRETVLSVVADAAGQFLINSNWRDNIDGFLQRLGETIDATHAYLFEQHAGLNGERLDSMTYEWTAPGFSSDLKKQVFQNMPLFENGFERYDSILSSGNPFIGSTSSLLNMEREHFSRHGIKAILEVPLIVNGVWWGTIGFDDHVNEREWTVSEVDTLKIAAGILSGVINRQETEAAVRESERIYRQAIGAAGAVPYYRNYEKNQYEFVGDQIEKMIGYKANEVTPQLWLDILQENIPLGEGDGTSIDEAIENSRTGRFKTWRSDMRVIAKTGEEKWITDSAVELFDNDNVSYASIGVMQDITDRKNTEANLRKRESILEAVAFAAEQFLKTPDWRSAIDMVLERLGRELNASHAYLFKRHAAPDGKMLSSMINEWTAPGFESDLENESFQNMVPTDAGFEHYYETLNQGIPLIGSSSSFTESEKEYWDSVNVKALLEIRIIVDGEQWGVLGFDEMSRKRDWLPMEVDVIKVAANVLGAAIKRQLDDDALKNELAERRRTEQALKFSEEKFSKAFYATQMLMTIEDDQHRFIEVNKVFEDTFGLSKEQIIGKSSTALNIFYDKTDVANLRSELQSKGSLQNFETRFRYKSGEMGFALLSSEKFHLDNNEYILTSGLDITERKTAELQIHRQAARAEALAALSQVLTQANQDYQAMLDTIVKRCAELIGDGASIFNYSPDQEFLELVAVYNPDSTAVEIFRNEIIVRPLSWNEGAYAVVIKEDRPILIPSIDVDDLIEEATPERREYYRNLPIYSMMLAPLHVQGRVIGIIGMARHKPNNNYTNDDLIFLQDIADRSALAMLNVQIYRELEMELVERRIAEEKYRSIFNNSIDGIFQSTEDGRFVSVNPAMARIYGYDSPEEMLQTINNIGEELYADQTQRDEVRRRLSSGQRLLGFETMDVRKDGSTFWASMTAQAIFAEDGSILYYEGSVEDITPRKVAEEEREALIQELANKNAELEQFTYTVSHDLKSPLVTISGFLGYLEQDAVSGNMDRLKKDTERIHEAVQKMQKLLGELLELSRVGRMMNTPSMVPMNELVNDALNIVHGQIVERGVTLHVQPDLPAVYVDRPRLVEVIQNLIDNAVKYMGERSDPQINIGLHGMENSNPIFYVQDNGIGIEPQHHERIFGLFNKLNARSDGTGVGLALVKRIIEFHQGRIWVESELGNGSTFCFTLPSQPKPDSGL